METLNFTPINGKPGKPMRIMFSHRDPSIRKSGQANLFIKYLDVSVDNKKLHDTFAPYGSILSYKIAMGDDGKSKGYGFVQFEKEESAQNAIKSLNSTKLNGKEIYVSLFIRKQERNQSSNGSHKFTNVYVKNLSATTTKEDLEKVFGKYGPITSAIVILEKDGSSRRFGFVNFKFEDDAATAVEKLNGTAADDGKFWYVGKAQRKADREAELRANFEQERNGILEKLQGTNLYLKNLDESYNTDESVKELFSEFGTVVSSKVMLGPQRLSRGAGFVAFSTPEEANKAVTEMNGKMIGSKPLYVALAQRKEDRKAKLTAHFAQNHAPVSMTPVPSGMPGFHPGGPRIVPQPLYFGHGAHGFLPQSPYGFQQQLIPAMRPGVGPNFLVPYALPRQGQPGQRVGPRRGVQQHQQQMLQHNVNQGYRLPMMVDVAGMPLSPMDNQRPSPGPVPIATLASALASASPERQRHMLGDQLYPLVERLEGEKNAGKVTGMLLEMDQTEVLHLIEAPDALKKKVGEAMDVLRRSTAGVEQLGSLSLND
ncbi:hypothetical protein ACHQM5_022098 [Ranunculus cassubicifolius]